MKSHALTLIPQTPYPTLYPINTETLLPYTLVSQSLRMGTHLRTLDLSHNPLGNKGIVTLMNPGP
jgi:hypothetical protein